MTGKTVGELIVRIPIIRDHSDENDYDYVEAGRVEILRLDLVGDDLELARHELDDGDFWGETDLYAKVREAVRTRKTGKELVQDILSQPWFVKVLADSKKVIAEHDRS